MLRRNELGLATSLIKCGGNNKGEDAFLRLGNLKVFSGKGKAMLFIIVGILVGVLLALSRFKVLVLVPTILIAACAIIVTGHELRVIALTILATAALLQIGYVVGCIARVYADAHLRARKAPRHRFSKSRHPA